MSTSQQKVSLQSPKTFRSWYIPEPLLIFRNGKTHVDPKLGLTLYGPLTTDPSKPATPMAIRVGIVGTGETIDNANRFIDKLSRKIPSPNDDPFLYPSFTGFQNAFDCTLIKSQAYNEVITKYEIDRVIKKATFFDRVDAGVNLFIDRIENISGRMPKADIVLCSLPQEIIDYCVVKKTKAGIIKKKKTKAEQKLIQTLKKYREVNQTFLDDFKEEAEKILEDEVSSSDFWRSLKAQAMKYDMPTQIVWPTTLMDYGELQKIGSSRQYDSTTAWNLAVALYYKGSGFPWTMTKMKKGTCYIGISFFRDLTDLDNRMRTSMAQIFTYTGEGLVLRGDRFEWDTEKGSPHLTELGAEKLLKKAISLYNSRMKEVPNRIVVHKSSKYWPEERSGFEKALRDIKTFDLIAFGKRGIRFFRYGNYPPMRGTVIELEKRKYLLYTRGYVPFLKTYPGARVPQPLEILEHYGDSPSETILSEILALSKMNWNSADFSLAEPITLVFSDKVGRVMASLPEEIEPKHEYLYYM